MATLKDIFKIHQPKAKYKVLPEIAKRWSPRYFSSVKIPAKHLNIIFEAARWTPSGHNHQPWYFYVCRKEKQNYKKIFSSLNDYNQSWAKSAPILIVACAQADNKFGKNPFAYYDLGAAVMALVLQAQNLGYYCRQMGLFNKNQVIKILKLKKEVNPFIIIAIGKIGDYRKAPKEIVEMETDPRPRKERIFEEI